MAVASSPRSSSVRSSFRSSFARGTHWLTVLLLTIAGAVIRFVDLGKKPFWFDECFSVEVARLDWRNVLHVLWWREANMSLYYVLLRIWLHFGDSEFFIRSLSVVISAATIAALYWLARLLYDRRIALIAAALLAFNAYSVRYAQEARSYALFLLLATLSSAFLVAYVRRRHRLYRLGYIVFSILAVYAHFYALLLLAAHWLAVRAFGAPAECADPSGSKLQPELRRAWIAVGIAVLPLLIFIVKTGGGPIHWIPRPTLRDLFEFFEHFCGADGWPMAVVFAAGFTIALVPIGKRLSRPDQSWDAWRCQFLLLWFGFPIVFTLLLSLARPVFLGRYMIFCLPALLILVAAGVGSMRRSWMSAIALCGILLLSWQGVAFVYGHDFDSERDGSGAASNFILDHAQPGDAILFHIAETRVPYEFFRSVRAEANTASPEFTSQFGPEIVFPLHGPGLDYRDFTGKPAPELVRSAVAAHPRVWIMLMNNGPSGNPDPTTAMLTQILPGVLPELQRWQFARVEVRLYGGR